MREILFRGKRIENGEWYYGSYLFLHISSVDWTGAKRGKPEDVHYIVNDKDINYAVYPSTIGQYTGMKDKNGKRIFEGDIVRCGTGRICKVTFFISPSFSGFDLVPIGGFDAQPPHRWSLFSDTEVIGNIHDNPELLEK